MGAPRTWITLLLLVALVPIAWFGVENWRSDIEASPPAPAVRASAPPARAQLGRSTYALDVRPMWAGQDGLSPAAIARPTPKGHALPADAVTPGADRGRALAMMARDQASTPSAGRRREMPLTGIPVLPTPPGQLSAAVAQGAASDPLAVVQFVGVMQDQQLLQRDDFWAQTMRELKIIVWWNVAGPQTQRLELFAPDGSLYRRYSAAFDPDAVPRTQGRAPVETQLPVGGTWITEYSLFGAWRVDVYLAGQPKPITSASFVLNP